MSRPVPSTNPSTTERRLYTVAEANRTLPYVTAVVRDARERYRAIRAQGRAHNKLPAKEADRRSDLKREIRDHAERIQACMEELEALGLDLKDYDLGLVDFPAELEGRSILLCWRFGETEVGFWHEVDAGYDGRRPVPPGQPGWPS